MNRRAQWIISEAGLRNLAAAGISTGWLKAWLLSAGASNVKVHLLESSTWQHSEASWQLFFADESALEDVAAFHGLGVQSDDQGLNVLPGADRFQLRNPERTCWFYHRHVTHSEVLLLPLGDIAYQRSSYLSRLNQNQVLQPLYVSIQEGGDLPLEPGLSASLGKSESEPLNNDGRLIEEQVMAALRAKNKRIRTVESCTGGGIAARLCRLPGASDVLDRAWVTYSNDAKREEVAVSEALLNACGAVSEQVVIAMAEGGVDSNHVCVAVSGIAGPDGGTPGKPVGTVWIAVAQSGHKTQAQCFELPGGRSEIQARTVLMALVMVLKTLGATTQLIP